MKRITELEVRDATDRRTIAGILFANGYICKDIKEFKDGGSNNIIDSRTIYKIEIYK